MKTLNIGKKLVAAMAMVVSSVCAFGDTWTEDDHVWYFTTNDVSATVTGVDDYRGKMEIPETLGGKPVVYFGSIFSGKEDITRVVIPASVTAISDQAFLNCKNLKGVTFAGNAVTSIGYQAFKGCYNMTSFTIPNSVTTLGQGVFSGCTGLKEITIGDGVETLTSVGYPGYADYYNDSEGETKLTGAYANGMFYNCTSLKTINWGKNVKTIGNIAFLGCSALESVTIPDTVTSIGNHAFYWCTNLENLKIGNGVTTIGRMAFRANSDLINVTFGTNIIDIGVMAFQDCVNLSNFTLPNTIRYLRYRCFAGCNKALTEVTIPTNKDNNETELGQGVFSGCAKLATVTFGDTLQTLTSVGYPGYADYYNDSEGETKLTGAYDNGMFYNCTSLKTINWGKNVKTIGNVAFLGCSALENVTIPDTVTSIGNHAFYWCDGLTTIKIGNKVKTIGRMAFRADDNLTNVTFGKKVIEIQQQAFQDCVNLKNFTLPASVQYLRYRCFAGCNKALTEVTIPTNEDELETELGQGVFSGCTVLAKVTIGDTVKTLTSVGYPGYADYYNDNDSSTKLTGAYENGMFYKCTSLKTINWGKNVETIGNVAFLGCSALESVSIPDTVTTIGCHAFYWCDNLQSVKIGAEVTTIGRMAFRADAKLEKVTFGGKVNIIEQQAFQDCVSLQDFTLPSTLQYLYYRCFAGCTSLTEVTIPANKSNLETVLGQGVFSGCTKLAKVTIGDTVKALTSVGYPGYADYYNDNDSSTKLTGAYENGMFYNCTSLKTVNFGTGLKTIGNVAFLNCSALEDVVIPANVSAIGSHAFFGCSSLRTVEVAGSLASIGRRAFANCPKLRYVDFQGAVMAYDAGSEIFAFDNDYVTAYAAEDSTGWTGVADVGGLPTDGKWRGATVKYGPIDAVKSYTVAFNGNGVKIDADSRKIWEGEAVGTLPTVTTPNGWKFLGWFTAATGGTAVSSTTKPTANVTYYAQWEKANLKFHTGGWSTPVALFSGSSAAYATPMTTFEEGDTIYLNYEFENGCSATIKDFVNKFTLSTGLNYADDWTDNELEAGKCGWLGKTNLKTSLLQDLTPGTYTLTCTLDATGVIEESDETDNVYTLTFTVKAKETEVETVKITIDGTAVELTPGAKYGTALKDPSPVSGKTFMGWYTGKDGTGTKVTADSIVPSTPTTLYAYWKTNVTPTPTPEDDDDDDKKDDDKKQDAEEEAKDVEYCLFGEDDLTGYTAAGQTYDGVMQDASGNPVGSITLKAAKMSKNKSKITVAAVIGGKKYSYKGEWDYSTDEGTIGAGKKGAPEFTSLIVYSHYMLGKLGNYTFQGARNVFTSKESADKTTANGVLNTLKGTYALTYSDANGVNALSVSIAAKGKVKVSGTLASGKKANVTTQLIVGNGICCIPVVQNKSGVNLAMNLWISTDGASYAVEGASGVKFGKTGTLKSNAEFAFNTDAITAALGDSTFAEYLPNGTAVAQKGAKWVVMPDANGKAAKAGKIALDKSGAIDERKSKIDGYNVANLKLTYTAKTGAFKGSFNAYYMLNGKLKSVVFTVTGVMIDGVGYGTATNKKLGVSTAITIK